MPVHEHSWLPAANERNQQTYSSTFDYGTLTWTRTLVGTKAALVFMVSALLAEDEHGRAALLVKRAAHRELFGQLLQLQIANVRSHRHTTHRTTRKMGTTVFAQNVPILALIDWRQDQLETNGTIEQTGNHFFVFRSHRRVFQIHLRVFRIHLRVFRIHF